MPTSYSRYASPVFFGLLVLAWIAPYAVVAHTYPVPTFYAEYTAYGLFVLLSIAIGVLTAQSASQRKVTSPRVAFIPLAFAALLIIQTIVLPTAQPSMNFLGAGCLLVAALATHAGFWTNRLRLGEEALRWTAWALVAGGLFALGCQLVQLFHAEARFAPFVVAYNGVIDRRPFGNMAQANHLGSYLSFAFAASVFLVQSRRMPLTAWVPLAACYSFGLALTVSRTPWLQAGIIFLMGLGMAWSDRRIAPLVRGWPNTRRWLVPALTVVLFVVVNMLARELNHVFGWHLAESAAERFHDAGQISPRLALWKYGWTMFITHPILGVGWGEFPRFQYELVEQLGRVEIANNSHDIVLDLLAKTGLVGIGIVAIGFAFWAWRVGRLVLRDDKSRTTGSLFAVAMLGILAVHAMVEYPQQYLFFLLPAAFLMGLLETESMPRVPAVVSGAGYCVVAAIAVLMSYWVLTDYHRAEKLYYGDRPEDEYRAAPSTIFGAWGEFGLATLLPLNTDSLAYKLAMHRQAIALLPGEVVLRRYAILKALQGDTLGAMDEVTRLQIFAESLHDWPSELATLIQLCDQQPGPLKAFKAQLSARYGVPADATAPVDAAPNTASDSTSDGASGSATGDVPASDDQ